MEIRILFLALDVDLASPRGDAVHTRELAKNLARNGQTVHLVTRSIAEEFALSGLQAHVCAENSDWAQVRFATNLARRFNLDVIYERRLSPKISFAASILSGLPFALEVNGSEEELSLQGRSSPAPHKWIRGIMYRRASHVVTVTQPLAIELQRRYGLSQESITIVPNGVDTNRFAPQDQLGARSKLGLPSRPLILFVGNLAPWQGLETLLPALARVRKEFPNIQAAILGDGALRETVRELSQTLGLENTVLMLGPKSNEDIPTYVGAADICVVGSSTQMTQRIGRSPLKLFEYMSGARPVVASDVPGVREILVRSGGGLLVPPDDPVNLGKALVRLLSSPEEAREMGRRGREFAVSECSWDLTARKVSAVLKMVVETA